MRIVVACLISAGLFLATLTLIAQLWVAIFFPVHLDYNIIRVWRPVGCHCGMICHHKECGLSSCSR